MRSRSRIRWLAVGVPVATAAIGLAAAQLVGAVTASARAGDVTASATSATDASLEKTVTATCPAGTSAVGVAASTTRPWAAHITGVVPKGRTATATARIFSGRGYTWSISATAICTPTPRGLQYVPVTSTEPVAPGDSAVGAEATCPGSKRLIGFGGSATGGRFLSFMPQSKTSADQATGIWVSGQAFVGNSGTPTMTAVAVCATGAFTTSYPETPLTGSTDGTPVASSGGCPRGYTAHAVAGWAAESDRVYISEVSVNAPLSAAGFTLRSANSGSFAGKGFPFCVR